METGCSQVFYTFMLLSTYKGRIDLRFIPFFGLPVKTAGLPE